MDPYWLMGWTAEQINAAHELDAMGRHDLVKDAMLGAPNGRDRTAGL